MAEEKQKHEKKPKQLQGRWQRPTRSRAKRRPGSPRVPPPRRRPKPQPLMKPPQAHAPPPRLIAHYREKVIPGLLEHFKYKNKMAVPRMEKIVISMGLGKAVTAGEKGKDGTGREGIGRHRGAKAGIRCKAIKSVANFKVREGGRKPA